MSKTDKRHVGQDIPGSPDRSFLRKNFSRFALSAAPAALATAGLFLIMDRMITTDEVHLAEAQTYALETITPQYKDMDARPTSELHRKNYQTQSSHRHRPSSPPTKLTLICQHQRSKALHLRKLALVKSRRWSLASPIFLTLVHGPFARRCRNILAPLLSGGWKEIAMSAWMWMFAGGPIISRQPARIVSLFAQPSGPSVRCNLPPRLSEVRRPNGIMLSTRSSIRSRSEGSGFIGFTIHQVQTG